MEIYRTNAAENVEIAAAEKPRRRAMWIVALSIAAHAAILGAAFVARAPTPVDTTRIVSVLVGHVDTDTGAFQAEGLARARIKR